MREISTEPEPWANGPTLATLQFQPTMLLERDALMAMIQQAPAIGHDLLAQVVTAQVHEPNLRVVRDALAAALPEWQGDSWIPAIVAAAPESHRTLVRELAVAPLPQKNADLLGTYARGVTIALLDRDLQALKQELLARLQRQSGAGGEDSLLIQQQLVALEAARRSLKNE